MHRGKLRQVSDRTDFMADDNNCVLEINFASNEQNIKPRSDSVSNSNYKLS